MFENFPIKKISHQDNLTGKFYQIFKKFNQFYQNLSGKQKWNYSPEFC